ncbi:hypothetical protein [Picosynechococcus sp. PCC 73109]|uniref:hypothetical protein n=1 Tax=Picosynechococcus sp. PCC 73109 TaxID=374982 RepID=UPI00074584F2|nr:hypothetical protein [Picosynechococcus sp. PCC 73109]AMA10177.1 hypothetical protein AWQ23_13080 [Picosynechococcus sp. PCC 73109]
MQLCRWRSLGLGVLLLFLWGCGANPPGLETEILTPSNQWQTLTTEQVQLDVPPGYVGGNPGSDLPALAATLEAWDKGDRLEWLNQNAETLELLAFQAEGDRLNSITIVQEERPEALTLEDYLQQQVATLQAAGITVSLTQTADQGRLELNRGDLTQVSYVYPETTTFWVITYSSDRPTAAFTAGVEQSQQSFQVRPESS